MTIAEELRRLARPTAANVVPHLAANELLELADQVEVLEDSVDAAELRRDALAHAARAFSLAAIPDADRYLLWLASGDDAAV